MKNRKLLIVSFLVVATLVVGVGFAALTGTLDITGSAKFIGSGMADTEVRAAINFTAAKAGDNAVVQLTDVDSNGYSKTADMTVEFHDLDGSTLGSSYEAYADFTITYGVEGELLPEMTLCSLDPTDESEEHHATVTMTGDNVISGEFTIEAFWLDEDGNPAGKAKKTMTPGMSVVMRVVVYYTEDEETDHPQDSFTKGINVFVPFHTVDNTASAEE